MRVVEQFKPGPSRADIAMAMIGGLCFARQPATARDRLNTVNDVYYHGEACGFATIDCARVHVEVILAREGPTTRHQKSAATSS